MSKQKKPRTKKYRPRTVRLNSAAWAIEGAATFPATTVEFLMKEPLKAIDILRRGAATREDWNMICQALNIAEALTLEEIGPNLMPAIKAGQDALHAIALRMLGTGSSTCYGAELAAIDEALTMYHAQIKLCTQAEFSRAFKRVGNWAAGGKMNDVAKMYYAMDQQAA